MASSSSYLVVSGRQPCRPLADSWSCWDSLHEHFVVINRKEGLKTFAIGAGRAVESLSLPFELSNVYLAKFSVDFRFLAVQVSSDVVEVISVSSGKCMQITIRKKKGNMVVGLLWQDVSVVPSGNEEPPPQELILITRCGLEMYHFTSAASPKRIRTMNHNILGFWTCAAERALLLATSPNKAPPGGLRDVWGSATRKMDPQHTRPYLFPYDSAPVKLGKLRLPPPVLDSDVSLLSLYNRPYACHVHLLSQKVTLYRLSEQSVEAAFAVEMTGIVRCGLSVVDNVLCLHMTTSVPTFSGLKYFSALYDISLKSNRTASDTLLPVCSQVQPLSARTAPPTRLDALHATGGFDFDFTFSTDSIGLELYSTRLPLNRHLIPREERLGASAMVGGFIDQRDGSPSPARASKHLSIGCIVAAVNGRNTLNFTFGETLRALRLCPRPMVITFRPPLIEVKAKLKSGELHLPSEPPPLEPVQIKRSVSSAGVREAILEEEEEESNDDADEAVDSPEEEAEPPEIPAEEVSVEAENPEEPSSPPPTPGASEEEFHTPCSTLENNTTPVGAGWVTPNSSSSVIAPTPPVFSPLPFATPMPGKASLPPPPSSNVKQWYDANCRFLHPHWALRLPRSSSIEDSAPTSMPHLFRVHFELERCVRTISDPMVAIAFLLRRRGFYGASEPKELILNLLLNQFMTRCSIERVSSMFSLVALVMRRLKLPGVGSGVWATIVDLENTYFGQFSTFLSDLPQESLDHLLPSYLSAVRNCVVVQKPASPMTPKEQSSETMLHSSLAKPEEASTHRHRRRGAKRTMSMIPSRMATPLSLEPPPKAPVQEDASSPVAPLTDVRITSTGEVVVLQGELFWEVLLPLVKTCLDDPTILGRDGGRYLFAVCSEFVRSLECGGIPVRSYIVGLIVDIAVHCGLLTELEQLLRMDCFGDSVWLAEYLVSMSNLSLSFRQIGVVMLQRLRRWERVVELLLNDNSFDVAMHVVMAHPSDVQTRIVKLFFDSAVRIARQDPARRPVFSTLHSFVKAWQPALLLPRAPAKGDSVEDSCLLESHLAIVLGGNFPIDVFGADSKAARATMGAFGFRMATESVEDSDDGSAEEEEEGSDYGEPESGRLPPQTEDDAYGDDAPSSPEVDDSGQIVAFGSSVPTVNAMSLEEEEEFTEEYVLT